MCPSLAPSLSLCVHSVPLSSLCPCGPSWLRHSLGDLGVFPGVSSVPRCPRGCLQGVPCPSVSSGVSPVPRCPRGGRGGSVAVLTLGVAPLAVDVAATTTTGVPRTLQETRQGSGGDPAWGHSVTLGSLSVLPPHPGVTWCHPGVTLCHSGHSVSPPSPGGPSAPPCSPRGPESP